MSTKSKMSPIEVKAMRLPNGLGLPFPEYQSEEAAGLDLVAAVPITAPVRLLPGTRQLIPTGLTLEIPAGYEGQVRPRSGLAVNHGVTVLNSPGTIDSDYRGEIMVLLVNLGRETFVVTRGQRIAQLVVQPVARAEIVDVRAVAASKRASNGFGSTGLDTVAAEAERDVAPAAAQAPVAAPAVKEAAKSAPVKLVQPAKEPAKPKKADPKPPAKTIDKATAKEAPKATVKTAPKLAAKAVAKPPSKTKRVDKPTPKKAAAAKPSPASKSKAGARA